MASGGSIDYIIYYHSKYGVLKYTTLTVGAMTTLTEEQLTPPTYDKASFLGWYSTSTFEENTKIEIGYFIGEGLVRLDLYAKWEEPEQVIANKKEIVAIADAVRDLYGSTDQLSLGGITENITLEKTNVTNALAALVEKGVEIPDGSNSDDLAELISSIKLGGFPNGTEWTQCNMDDNGTSITNVTNVDGMWFASTYSKGLYYSIDGKSWHKTNITVSERYGGAYDIHKFKNLYIAFGYYNGIWYSEDGISWLQTNITSVQTSYVKCFECDMAVLATSNGILVSSDGITWEQYMTGEYVYSLMYQDHTWCIATKTMGFGYSTDGTNWNTGIVDGVTDCRLRFQHNGHIIGFDSSTETFYHSNSGKEWAVIEGISCVIQDADCFSYCNGYYFFGTEAYRSIDCVTWEPCQIVDLESFYFSKIVYHNGLYLAYKSDKLYYSSNAIEWYQGNVFEGTILKIMYNNGMWLVSVKGEGIYQSENGINWILALSSTNYSVELKLVENVWLSNTHYSLDGKLWNEMNSVSNIGYSGYRGIGGIVHMNGISVARTASSSNDGIYYSVTWEPNK